MITAVVSNGNLLIELEDGSIINAGRVQGPAGRDGAAGAEGPRGSAGISGRDGQDGASIRTGFGAPSPDLYRDGDLYIDVQSANLSLYQKIAGDWASLGSMKGQPGPPGLPGTDGSSEAEDWGAIISPNNPPAVDNSGEPIQNGDIWFDTTSGYIYIFTSNGWIPISDKPPATVSPTPPEFNPSSDETDPNKRYPVKVGDLWFDSEQLALYTAVEDAQGDLTWIIATPADRSAVLDEVPGTFVLPAAATDKTVATNDVTGVRYIYNEPKNQWIDISNQCWREDLVYSDTAGGGGDFYKELNAFVFNTPKTWTFSKFITKVGDTIYINAKPFVVTSYTEIPVDGQTTGMAVELDPDPTATYSLFEGETYDVSNCPLELDRQVNRDLVSQLRGQFEFDADGKAILPDGIITETNNIFYQLPGLWWAGPAVQANPNYQPSAITHLLVSKGRSAEETDDQGNMVWIDGSVAPSFQIGDIIHVNGRHIHADKRVWDLKYLEGFGHPVDNVWRVVNKVEIVNPNNVNIYNLDDIECYAVTQCVAEEKYSRSLWWGDEEDYEIFSPVTVSPWYEPETFRKGSRDLVMQLRDTFELDGDGNAILPADIISSTDVNGVTTDYSVPGVWWIDPTLTSTQRLRYDPKKITHVLLHGGRWVESYDENTGEYTYNDASLTPQYFNIGDFINISGHGFELYVDIEDAADREAWGQRFDDVWRVTKVINVIDSNNVAPGWGFEDSLRAYEIEKVVPEYQYSNSFSFYREDNDETRIPCKVTYTHDVNDIQWEVFGGEGRYWGLSSGRQITEIRTWTGGDIITSSQRTAVFHPTENYCAFNRNTFGGYTNWQTELSPYPHHILLNFANGEKYDIVVEHIGYQSYTENFRILDRGNLPLGDLSSIDGIEFDIYKDYEPARDGLQTQIDGINVHLSELDDNIVDLVEEIEGIAPSSERGIFNSALGSSGPADGEVFMSSLLGAKITDYGDTDISVISVSKVDSGGGSHTFVDVEVGQLIELIDTATDDDDYGMFEITQIAGVGDPGQTAVTFTVDYIRGSGTATPGQPTRVKIFSPPEGGTADGFVKKSGDDVNGNLTMIKEPFNNGDFSPEIRFKSKKSDGTVYTNKLYMPYNTSSTLKVSSTFATGGSIACGGAIQLSGNVQYGSSTRIGLGSDTYTHYLGFGTSDSYKAIQWNKGSGVTSLRVYNSTGSSGQVLTRTSNGLEWKTPDTSSTQYTITYSGGNYYIS